MEAVARQAGRPVRREGLQKTIGICIRKKASPNQITWVILGGKKFRARAPETSFDYLTATDKGIPKQAVVNLAEVMDIPMKDIAALLNLSYKTLARKRNTDPLDSLVSSLSIEIAHTVAKGLALFEDTSKLNRWLQKENRALTGKKPIELLNTPTGINLVNKVLLRMEEGVYT